MTYWLAPFAVQWDFGAAQAVDDVLFGGGPSESTFVLSATLQGSADGFAWSTVVHLDGCAYPGAGSMQAYDPDGDHLWNNVELLLPFNGANGSTTFQDKSRKARSFTAAGNAQISTARSVFGGASGYFDGSGDSISTSATGLAIGTSSWTLEFRYYNENTTSSNNALMCQRDSFSDLGWIVAATTTGLAWQAGPANSPAVSVSAPFGEFHDYCFERTGNVLTAARDGVVVASTAITSNLTHAGTLYIGRLAFQSAVLKGNLDNLRYTIGVSRNQGQSFALAAGPHPERGKNTIVSPRVYAQRLHAARVARAEGYGPESLARGGLSSARFARDAEHGGRGTITGTVKIDSTPTDLPVRRRVRLVRERDGITIRETWSDATTGAYSFAGVDETQRYSVISYDHTHDKRAVIADNLAPEVAA